jgi:hypothetical protein
VGVLIENSAQLELELGLSLAIVMIDQLAGKRRGLKTNSVCKHLA